MTNIATYGNKGLAHCLLWSSKLVEVEKSYVARGMILNDVGHNLVGSPKFGNHFKLCVNLIIDLVRAPSTIVDNRRLS